MAEFYDELFDVEDVPDFDVNVIFPDGSKVEMFLPTVPNVGDIMKGYIIEKIIVSENYKDGEFYGSIILNRREDLNESNRVLPEN